MNEEQKQETAVVPRAGAFTLAPQTLAEAMKFSELIAGSELCPKQFRGRPQDVLIAVQIGAEVGVSPMQALSNIAVINGRPCMWGDLVTALVQRTGELEYLRESWDPQTQTATARIKRRGLPEHVETFSMADARRAGLDQRDTYKQYPQRMCGWRAKTWAIRAQFSDALKGITTREEAEEMKDLGTAEAETVMMPRRVGETASVEEFLGQKQQAPAAVPSSGGETWTGPILSMSQDTGTKKNGKPWTIYKFHCEGGKSFGTFHDSVRDMAKPFVGTGEIVVIEYAKTSKGNLDIVSVRAEHEPGEDEGL